MTSSGRFPDEARAAYAHVMAGLIAAENPGIRIECKVPAEDPDAPPHVAYAKHAPTPKEPR